MSRVVAIGQRVLLNGELLKEPYLDADVLTYEFAVATVPEGLAASGAIRVSLTNCLVTARASDASLPAASVVLRREWGSWIPRTSSS